MIGTRGVRWRVRVAMRHIRDHRQIRVQRWWRVELDDLSGAVRRELWGVDAVVGARSGRIFLRLQRLSSIQVLPRVRRRVRVQIRIVLKLRSK